MISIWTIKNVKHKLFKYHNSSFSMEKFPLLLNLAKQGAGSRSVLVSTAELSESLMLSQQTMSRDLRQLEDEGFIERKPTPQGTRVYLTQKAMKYLTSIHYDLHGALDHAKLRSISGIVQDGIGEGRYYMSQEPYQAQFERLLGFRAYPGTLNLRVEPEQKAHFLAGIPSHSIEGFVTSERTFGGLSAYSIALKQSVGALIIPLRTTHPANVVELIAPRHLRTIYKLKSGASFTLFAGASS